MDMVVHVNVDLNTAEEIAGFFERIG